MKERLLQATFAGVDGHTLYCRLGAQESMRTDKVMSDWEFFCARGEATTRLF